MRAGLILGAWIWRFVPAAVSITVVWLHGLTKSKEGRNSARDGIHGYRNITRYVIIVFGPGY
jgi:hypothetical protein